MPDLCTRSQAMRPTNDPITPLNVLKRTWPLLSAVERRRAGGMLGLIFLNSFVEILGLAAVVPVIGVAMRPELIEDNRWLARAYEATGALGIASHGSFLALLTALMLAGFLFKGGFGLFVTWAQSRFALSVGHRLAGRMWTNHFANSLERMRAADSGQIQGSINSWPLAFSNAFITGGLTLLTEVAVLALIAGGLVVYEPLILLSIAVLLAIGVTIIRRTTKHKLNAYSEALQRLEPRSVTLITNALRGFLEVITFRASDAVRDSYLRTRREIFRINAHRNVMNQMPAKLYEVLAVGIIAAAIFLSLVMDLASDAFFELLTLLALSAYRVMPSMSRINGYLMNMRASAYLLRAMEEGVAGADAAERAAAEQHAVMAAGEQAGFRIVCEALSLGYSSLAEPVLSGLSCAFEPGKVHAVVGASGSGKSTLISALLGLHAPLAGAIAVEHGAAGGRWTLGGDLHHRDWLAHVGYLSQSPFLFAGTLRENLTLRVPGIEVDEALTADLIERLDLGACLGAAPLDFVLNEGGSNLSGGQQQRVALLRALQVERAVLILDEATSALDTATRDRVFALLRERAAGGCNVILVTHDREIAAKCDDRLELGGTA